MKSLFAYEKEGDGIVITGCNPPSGTTSVVIPEKIDGLPVTSIGDSAFGGCTGLTSITIPNSVTSIEDWTFASCTGLTSITIPNSVTSIWGSAFYDCTGLTSITISNNVTSIWDGAFSGCSGLKTVQYGGSKADREKMTIGEDNYYLENAEWVYAK